MKKPLYIFVAVVALAFVVKVLLHPSNAVTASIPPSASATAKPSALKDGTYPGDAISNEYGAVQVSAVISGGKITDIVFVQLPSGNPHTIEVSATAKPVLLQETLKSQSTTVDAVSGATQTSESYSASLSTALAKAT
jgi:uncharacterized protein with FMN-binding domain